MNTEHTNVCMNIHMCVHAPETVSPLTRKTSFLTVAIAPAPFF